jgi:hypothetical protein
MNHKQKRTYFLLQNTNFTIENISLISSVRILPYEDNIPELDFSYYVDAPTNVKLFINGFEISDINSTGESNYFDFNHIRNNFRKIDPYDEDGDYNTNLKYYNLEQILLNGQIEAMGYYKNLTDEELEGSIFTPYAVIKFKIDDSSVNKINIEEEYFLSPKKK